MTLERRPWVPDLAEDRVQTIARAADAAGSATLFDRLTALVDKNTQIHTRDCFNLNPATNVMNPRAEAMLASGIGSRPSLGYPGDKYEMGLEAIEEIEVIAAALAAEIFDARFAEIRVPSGAMANMFGFMALCQPGDTIIVPPASIGGHVTHHDAGCAGLYGLTVIEAPVAADGYTVDVAGLAAFARDVQPKLITIGSS
ncbi:MAG: serine hydroxymethyltransferase, partial [Pseudomonadota bacterium]